MPKKLSDISNRTRQQHLLALLEAAPKEGLSVLDISKRLKSRGIEVTSKTIRRDINDLSRDYAVSETNTRPLRFALVSKKSVAQLELTLSELQTLAIALSSLNANAHGVFHDSLSSIENTLLKSLNKERVKFYETTKSQYLFLNSSGSAIGGENKDIEEVLLALRRRRCFRALYQSPYKSSKVENYEPLRLIMNAGIPYLDVWDLSADAPRRLRLTRISNVKILDASINEAHMKKLLSPDDLFGAFSDGKSVKVTLEGDQVLAQYFSEKKIHPSQKLEFKNKKAVVSLKIPLSHEFVRTLASLAPHIKSVAPKQLQQSVVTFLKEGLQSLT